MPLNIENKQYVSIEEETSPKPILHKPGKQYSSARYFFLGIFIIAVTTSSLFLLYLFYMNIYLPPGATEADLQPSRPETGVAQVQEPSPSESAPIKPEQTVEPVAPPPVKTAPAAGSRYTIYLGVYPKEKPASDEVKRWNGAGFISAVARGKNDFRVTLGRFQTEAEAREFAGQWSDAFEYGFWIGTFE